MPVFCRAGTDYVFRLRCNHASMSCPGVVCAVGSGRYRYSRSQLSICACANSNSARNQAL